MKFTVTGGKKFASSINFLKQQKNWNQMVWVAMHNVADDIREDAVKKLFTKFEEQTGGLRKSIKASVARRGNNTYIGLGSDHPAAAIMEYGGYSPLPSVPSKTHEGSKSIVKYTYHYDHAQSFWWLAQNIHRNQPFQEGLFYMRRALNEGLPKLESEIMKTYHRMKP
jgi:hypothetical protein